MLFDLLPVDEIGFLSCFSGLTRLLDLFLCIY